ncbi:Radical SAM domain protein [Chitinivibrio alkaliphilus ACht1]|uniref:7-carboxy-7-deazaguanine synthase n=1 Tax=Chitinivibrio alkaliphilus ACht1 TaxID=1313304 RepID=U7D6T5_9BACT|nr:Radical SAM domain protein [Chitinivibrio alkaliphilus ACht1]
MPPITSDSPVSTLTVCELFTSLQGESTHAGRVCSFIRLAGCNLRCHYCDTTYSYGGGQRKSFQELLAWLATEKTSLVEITGGEPLCQDAVVDFSALLLQQGYEVLVETNGTWDVSVLPGEVQKIIDYKLPGSGATTPFFRENFSHISSRDEVKFVISDRADYECAKEIVQNQDIAGEVLFSPVEQSCSLKGLAEWIVEDRLRVRLGVQLHKVIWGSDTKGV